MKWWKSTYFSPSIHILIWLLLLGIPTLIFQPHEFMGLPPYFFHITSIAHIGIFYLNAFVLYPKLLTRKYWWLYIITLVAILFLVFRIKVWLMTAMPGFTLTPENRGVMLFGIAPFIAASFIFRLVHDRLRFEKLQKEARNEQLASELKFLRSQISPHFLFNMMTNMVALARQESKLLEPSLIRLSELLRYMLYESNGPRIQVDQEIAHLENYVELQRLRFQDAVRVEILIGNHCDDCLIEPLLLLPFIENAFKHGIGIQSDPYVRIELDVTPKLLDFRVFNNYSRAAQSKDNNSGIGLVNVKNRLKLLYPGRYSLQLTDNNETFSVHLKIELS